MILEDDDETTTHPYYRHTGWAYASDRMVEKFSDSYPSIFLCLVIAYIMMVPIWLGSRSNFSKTFEKNRNEWKKHAEFTIIKHAHLKTKTNFSAVMILLGPVLIMDYFVPNETSSSGLECLVIMSRFALAISTYVLLIFVQLYHILLVIFLIEDFHREEPTSDLSIELRQTEKKFWIRKLYRFFLVRDLLVFPAFLLPDITSMDRRGYLLYYGEVFLVTTHITIYATVPISLLVHFLMKKLNISQIKELNSLQHQILYHAVGISVFHLILLALSWMLTRVGWIPREILPHIPQSSVLTLPLVIQVTTGFWSRKLQKEVRPNLNCSSRMFSDQ